MISLRKSRMSPEQLAELETAAVDLAGKHDARLYDSGLSEKTKVLVHMAYTVAGGRVCEVLDTLALGVPADEREAATSIVAQMLSEAFAVAVDMGQRS